jgi:hypothetical protein
MEDLERTVTELARRVQALEDELAIHRLIVRYGLGVDAGDADRGAGVFTEDACMTWTSAGWRARRRACDGARERHQEMVGHCTRSGRLS